MFRYLILLFKFIVWVVGALIAIGLVIENGAEFLVLIFKAGILLLVTGLIVFITSKIGLFPKSDNVSGQIAGISFCFILAASLCAPLEVYLIKELGWHWLKVVPKVPPGNNVPPLKPLPGDYE
ncbi:hypothetical protein ABE957_11995 [Halomonas sp. CS7]|uniref:Uncharacterized protein n=1 Tax=Halomonas pelophila TaxID=3151122 RepID=A0ABV1N8J8_9GAMM